MPAGAEGGSSSLDGGASSDPSAGGIGSAGDAGSDGGQAGSAPVNPPPTVAAVAPSPEQPVEPDTQIVVTFSEPVDETTLDGAVQILLGDEPVAGELEYSEATVTFTPSEPLVLAGDYTVRVSTDVTDVEGAGLASPFEAEFSVRDGKFSTIVAVEGGVRRVAEHVPVEGDGSVLLSWNDAADGDDCPVRYQRFLHEVPLGAPQSLSAAGSTSCREVTAATNMRGVSAVAWRQHGGSFIRQLRAGSWSTTDAQRSTTFEIGGLALGIAANGSVSLLEQTASLLDAHQTAADGKWIPMSGVDDTTQGDTNALPALGFDAAHDGLAVWRVHPVSGSTPQQISFSRFSSATGEWSAAAELKGSKAAQVGVNFERGAPGLAVGPSGDAVAVWVSRGGVGNAAVVASHFTAQEGWTTPVELAPTLRAEMLDEPPAVVHDGTTFVTAFTAHDGSTLGTYTVRYDLAGEQWLEAEKRQAQEDAVPVGRMPKLAGDGRGRLLLVWLVGTSPNYAFYFQRYARDGWGATTRVFQGGAFLSSFGDSSFYNWSLASNERGLAALSWPVDDTLGFDTKAIKLASFY